jgi:hypothetical protein
MNWQPIETAPRDGTPVDLWHKAGFRNCEQWWDNTDKIWVPDIRPDNEYSHWMPLPPPPQ